LCCCAERPGKAIACLGPDEVALECDDTSDNIAATFGQHIA